MISNPSVIIGQQIFFSPISISSHQRNIIQEVIEELKFSLQQTIVISKVERRKQNGIHIRWEEYTPVLYVSLSIQPL